MDRTTYRTVRAGGLSVFYREAGPADAPAILLLHGFPSSSRMWQPLLDRLAGPFRLIAPDYPGFGHSDAPSHTEFEYTFDHLAAVVGGFTQAVPLWKTRREFWADRETHEAALRENFFSFAATRQRHLGTSPNVQSYDPDLWTNEFAFLSQPGQQDIQTDLFYDYRTNVASYPAWQRWLREHRPPLLVLWGRYDASFQVDEAKAYLRDVPDAEVHVLNAGHFALDEQPDQIADLTRGFLQHLPPRTDG